MKIVEVTWEDAAESTAWQTGATAGRFHKTKNTCVTVGMLLVRDRDAVTVACSMASTGEVGGVWRIPAGMVKRVRSLGTSRKLA